MTSASRIQIGSDGFERPAEQLQHAVADERADHEDVAVREVEELQHAVDERVAERDQRVDAAERQAVDGELDELVHVGCLFIERQGGSVARAAPVVPLHLAC